MSDCSNVSMRERLPDLLHGRLTPAEVSEVERHLSACAECNEELEILRTARAVLARTSVPRIDTAKIVAALPVATRPATAMSRAAQRWRIAAAITLVAIGGTSVATFMRSSGGSGGGVADSGAVVVPPTVATVDSPRATSDTPRTGAVRLTAGGDVSDLADEDLEALIGALESIETAPHAEPQASRLPRLVPESTGGN